MQPAGLMRNALTSDRVIDSLQTYRGSDCAAQEKDMLDVFDWGDRKYWEGCDMEEKTCAEILAKCKMCF